MEVKPLKWEIKYNSPLTIIARTIGDHHYCIEKRSSVEFMVYFEENVSFVNQRKLGVMMGSLKEAKEFCNKHHKRDVLEVIEDFVEVTKRGKFD